MSDERGDLLKRYDELARRDDERMRESQKARGKPSAIQLGDFLPAALGIEEPKGLDAAENFRTNFSFATVEWERRAMAADFRPEVIEQMKSEALSDIQRAFKICESPIERHILPWLVFGNWGLAVGQEWPAAIYMREDKLFPRGNVAIIPQMAFVRLRLDFGIVVKRSGHTHIIAVECDGVDYHERDRDIIRDGFLASFGIRTVRAYGKEIFQEPEKFFGRVSSILLETEG